MSPPTVATSTPSLSMVALVLARQGSVMLDAVAGASCGICQSTQAYVIANTVSAWTAGAPGTGSRVSTFQAIAPCGSVRANTPPAGDAAATRLSRIIARGAVTPFGRATRVSGRPPSVANTNSESLSEGTAMKVVVTSAPPRLAPATRDQRVAPVRVSRASSTPAFVTAYSVVSRSTS